MKDLNELGSFRPLSGIMFSILEGKIENAKAEGCFRPLSGIMFSIVNSATSINGVSLKCFRPLSGIMFSIKD